MIISAQNKCSSLVCSCYVPSRNSSDIKLEEEEENNNNNNNNSPSKNQYFAENFKNGSSELMEEQGIKNSTTNCQENIIKNGLSYSIEKQQPTPIKSNLKRSTRTTTAATVVMEDTEKKRKVSWPDAYGKDIARVHEFEASLSEDEELEGVMNSCVCTIQ